MIEKLSEEDIDQVAEIHMQTMPGGIIGALGPRFLRSIYYKQYIISQYAFAFVYKEEHEVIGIATACYDSGKFSNELVKKNKVKLTYYLLRGMLKSRQVFSFLLERIRESNIRKNGTIEDNINKQIMDIKAELMVIAVKPGMQGKKIGQQLNCTWIKNLKDHGIQACKITVNSQNGGMISLQKKFGFKKFHTFKSHGKEWCLMINRNIRAFNFNNLRPC